ncbi:MAG: DUF5041 domain-containing protein [Bacteroidaceae bacterium]|nr:DUF5041 domain-containing protein [Bacteroidaceae bacterium]
MKQAIITILLTLVTMAGHGQKIKRIPATTEDFMEHMAMYGYEVFTYDISSLRDSASNFTVVIREYDQHRMVDENKLHDFRIRTMISDFNEQDQKEIYAEKDADDLERGIYRLSKILSIGFSPVQSDSIETITLRASRNDASPWRLMLKPIPGAPKKIYRYEKVAYQPGTFRLETFIPLALYGSFWWDPQMRGLRFCGETELTEKKAGTSNFFKFSPHYYIIGAIFHK